MTTDFENELRDLFREKAEEAPLATPAMPASAPPHVLRRGRLHQVGTVLGSMVVVVVLILGSVAGLTRILGEGGDDRDTGNGGYDTFQRTATIEAFTVGSPSDWYLVNQWPASMLIAVEGSGGSSSKCVAVPSGEPVECDDNPAGATTSSPIPVPHGLPMLQLSNVDLGLEKIACRDGLRADAAVLYVGYIQPGIDPIAPDLNPFPPGPGMPPPTEGPCGRGSYAEFTVNRHSMFVWVGIGSDASGADREAVEASYEMMSAIPDWEPQPPDQTTPAYVIAGGTSEAAEDWRLELRSGEPNPVITLERSGGASVSALLDDVLFGSSYEPELTDPIFGAIAKAATGVEFRPGTENTFLDLGQSPVAGTIAPIPPTMGAFDFDVFFIDPPEGYADLGGHVIALGVEMPSVEPPPVGEARDEVVELSGTFLDQSWRVRFTGAFADATACIRARTGDANGWGGELCPRPLETSLSGDQPSLHVLSSDFALVVGSVPPEVAEIRFTSENGSNSPSQFQCQMGPVGWTDPDRRVCAIALPPQDGGIFEYLDSEGNVLFEDGMGWGTAEPELAGLTVVQPVHGGSYWAVYAWVGAPGSLEADDVSAQLLAEFGIEAFLRDLACDDGAAEALGTDAEQGIGVYFETEDEAKAFAQQAGLLGHDADPVIAHVTTYCLD
jgi:hypothetical protein